MERDEKVIPDLEGSNENRSGRDGQMYYPVFVSDPDLQEVPDTPEMRAYHRRVIRRIQESAVRDRDEREAKLKAEGDRHEYPPRERRG